MQSGFSIPPSLLATTRSTAFPFRLGNLPGIQFSVLGFRFVALSLSCIALSCALPPSGDDPQGLMGLVVEIAGSSKQLKVPREDHDITMQVAVI